MSDVITVDVSDVVDETIIINPEYAGDDWERFERNVNCFMNFNDLGKKVVKIVAYVAENEDWEDV